MHPATLKSNRYRSSFKAVVAAVIGSIALTACTSEKKPSASKLIAPLPQPQVVDTREETCKLDPALSGGITLIRSEYKEGELTELCGEAIAEAEEGFAEVVKADGKADPVKNLLAFDRVVTDLQDKSGELTFMAYVSTDEKLRDEGSACEEKIGQYFVDVSTRKEIYDAIKGVTSQDPELARLASETILSFERDGLKLEGEKLAEFKKIKQELTGLETKFSANLNNDVSSIELGKEELAGVSDAFLARLKKAESGKYIVTTKSTDYTQVMQNASSSETRRKMLLAYNNRAAESNTALLEQAIGLRAKLAALLGHKTWADYRTDGRMAQSSENVLKFLNGLKEKLALRNKKDIEQLLAYKKELDPSAEKWDPLESTCRHASLSIL